MPLLFVNACDRFAAVVLLVNVWGSDWEYNNFHNLIIYWNAVFQCHVSVRISVFKSLKFDCLQCIRWRWQPSQGDTTGWSGDILPFTGTTRSDMWLLSILLLHWWQEGSPSLSALVLQVRCQYVLIVLSLAWTRSASVNITARRIASQNSLQSGSETRLQRFANGWKLCDDGLDSWEVLL